MKSEPFVRSIAEKLGTDIVLPLDVRESGQFGQLFDSIRQIWGQVDICLHSIPFARRTISMRVSWIVRATGSSPRWTSRSIPSFAWCAVPRRWSEKVVERYNIMGPVKATLAGECRLLGAKFGRAF